MPSLLLVATEVVLLLALVAILVWLIRMAYLSRVERRLRARTGLYRDLIAGLATRERGLLEPVLAQLSTLRDVEAIEALLEEQAGRTTARPAWLLDAYDRLDLIQKYVQRLRNGRSWRERAFAAELLGRVGGASVVPALIETAAMARTEDADVRETALRALARIADPQAAQPLVEALGSAEVWLAPRITDILVRHGENAVDPLLAFLEKSSRHPARPWAIAALGEIPSRRAYPALVTALNDPDDEVRAKAATALGRLGDRRAGGHLLERLLGDPAPHVRARIATALGQFNDPDVIDRLVRALGDPAWWVRLRSVEALEHIGTDAEGPLLAALDDTDPEIRTRAAVALERIGLPARLVRAIAEGEPPDNVSAVLDKFAASGAKELLAEEMEHGSAEVRRTVLASVRHARRRDLAVEIVRLATKDPEPEIRALALEALADLGVSDALDAARSGANDVAVEVRRASIGLLALSGGAAELGTMRALAHDNDAGVRAAAARALPRLDREGSREALDVLLQDSSAEVRQAALEAAVAANLKTLASRVSERLSDPDPQVRRVAVGAVGRLADRAAIADLLRGARDGPELWPAIAAAVVRIDAGAVGDLLKEFQGEGGVPGRIAVIEALTAASTPGTLSLLLTLRNDTEPRVRAAVAQALGTVQAPEAVEALSQSLRDPSPAVRASAVDALVMHRGTPLDELGLLSLLREDPSPEVRERTALTMGLLELTGGELALAATCRASEPPAVLAAAVLALGAFPHQNMVASLVALADEAAVRAVLLTRLSNDAHYRLLRDRLPAARRSELRALQLESRESMEGELADGMRSTFDPAERLRLVAGLRALHGDRSRGALALAARSDPSPQVRAAALEGAGSLLAGEELLHAAKRGLGDPSPIVRKVAVDLFRRVDPVQGLPALMQQLSSQADEELHRTVAELADASFEPFVDLVLGLAPDGDEVLTFAEVARYMRHPGLRGLLGAMAQSGAPRIRAYLAVLLAARPELADPKVVAALLADPQVEVRRAAVRTAAATGATTLLEQQAHDPDADVRRDAALAFVRTATKVPTGLLQDPDSRVRAAAVAVELGSGRMHDVPDDVDLDEAASAVREGLDLEALRTAATSEPKATKRRSAALALTLIGDPLAATLETSDPDAGLRSAVKKLRARRAAKDGS